MKFTVAIPLGEIAPGEFQSMSAIVEMVRALESAKIDACHVTDHPAPSATWLHSNGHDALDPFTALAFVAAVSNRLRLHTNILVLAYRNPFITAKAASTLQVLSGGRLILGVGAGYQKSEFDALGVDFHKRGVLMDEALEVLELAWAGGAVIKQGLTFNATGNEPRPVPNPKPAVWIGGGSDKALQRAARCGDGWSPFFAAPTLSKLNQETGIQSPEHLGERIKQLQEMRANMVRNDPFDIAIGPRRAIRVCTSDEAQLQLDELHQLKSVGVTWGMIELPHPSRAAYVENVRWFAEEVVARL